MFHSSFEELSEALENRLKKGDDWKKIEAKLRAEVFRHLNSEGLPPPLPSKDEKVKQLNEFVIRYLRHQGYSSTLSVFLAESGTTVSNESVDFEKVIDSFHAQRK